MDHNVVPHGNPLIQSHHILRKVPSPFLSRVPLVSRLSLEALANTSSVAGWGLVAKADLTCRAVARHVRRQTGVASVVHRVQLSSCGWRDGAAVTAADHDGLFLALLVFDLADNHTLGDTLDNAATCHTRDVDVNKTDILDSSSEVAGQTSSFCTPLVTDGSTRCS